MASHSTSVSIGCLGKLSSEGWDEHCVPQCLGGKSCHLHPGFFPFLTSLGRWAPPPPLSVALMKQRALHSHLSPPCACSGAPGTQTFQVTCVRDVGGCGGEKEGEREGPERVKPQCNCVVTLAIECWDTVDQGSGREPFPFMFYFSSNLENTRGKV